MCAKVTIAAGVLFLVAAGVTPARADPITLAVSAGPTIQQIDNRPCVIGDPSCHNPSALPYTLLPPHDATDTVSSPTYTVDQIRNLVGGNTFVIGVDLNQAMGHNGGDYFLTSFTLAVNGLTAFSTAGPTTLMPLNPGNGYSDATIAGFDLTGLAGDASLVFTTTFSGGTAGREQYFLRPVGASAVGGPSGGPAPTPEPATLLLLGSGIVGVLRHARARA